MRRSGRHRGRQDVTLYSLAIDQGTTSSRALLFAEDYRVAALAQEEFPQHYPASGWVEHDPEDIWRTTLATARVALAKAGAAADIVAIGITNQRETTLVWDARPAGPYTMPSSGRIGGPRMSARSSPPAGARGRSSQRPGLRLDPYFSATKIAWILDHVPGARAKAERGELAFGTVDTFLLWRLTGGRVHATDATNASRTCLFDIIPRRMGRELLQLFRVPRELLPEVRDNAAEFGTTEAELLGAPIPIRGMAGDQQAATIGQACFTPGMIKSTYGTGCFAVRNTGDKAITSHNRLLSTIAYQLEGERTYALEGSIFIAGAAVQWLRDALRVIPNAGAAGRMAQEADPSQDVVLVPAFVGTRSALLGRRLPWRALRVDAQLRPQRAGSCRTRRGVLPDERSARGHAWRLARRREHHVRVDGGMAASDWTMQRLADILDAPVDRPTVLETTALGAAYLAGLQSGFYPEPEKFAERWALDRRFSPITRHPSASACSHAGTMRSAARSRGRPTGSRRRRGRGRRRRRRSSAETPSPRSRTVAGRQGW